MQLKDTPRNMGNTNSINNLEFTINNELVLSVVTTDRFDRNF